MFRKFNQIIVKCFHKIQDLETRDVTDFLRHLELKIQLSWYFYLKQNFI